MPRWLSPEATTRRAGAEHAGVTRPEQDLLARGQIVFSPETRLGYKVDRLLGEKPFTAYTKYTITTLRALKADLAEGRQRGFAISYEEHELGVGTVAAPIVINGLDGNPRCVGVVSLAAPTSRMDRALLTQ